MHQTPFLRTSTGVFQIPISHSFYPTFLVLPPFNTNKSSYAAAILVAVLFATKRLLWISVQITEPSLSLNYRYKNVFILIFLIKIMWGKLKIISL